MTRKATAKSAEANAAVLSRAAGLDQRFKMSASVASLPSNYAATACLSFFVARVGARWGSGDTQCCNRYEPLSMPPPNGFASVSKELYFALLQHLASRSTLPFESPQAL